MSPHPPRRRRVRFHPYPGAPGMAPTRCPPRRRRPLGCGLNRSRRTDPAGRWSGTAGAVELENPETAREKTPRGRRGHAGHRPPDGGTGYSRPIPLTRDIRPLVAGFSCPLAALCGCRLLWQVVPSHAARRFPHVTSWAFNPRPLISAAGGPPRGTWRTPTPTPPPSQPKGAGSSGHGLPAPDCRPARSCGPRPGRPTSDAGWPGAGPTGTQPTPPR